MNIKTYFSPHAVMNEEKGKQSLSRGCRSVQWPHHQLAQRTEIMADSDPADQQVLPLTLCAGPVFSVTVLLA